MTLSHTTLLNEWYQHPLGTELLAAENLGLAALLPQLFGYYLVQLGAPCSNDAVYACSHIHNRILVCDTPITQQTTLTTITSQFDQLPFLPDSIDVIVLFHVLEAYKNYHAILDEIYKALIPGGHLIIISFNPQSLWGLKRIITEKHNLPWSGHWASAWQMRRSLTKHGFSAKDYQTIYFRPPMTNSKLRKQLLFMETLGPLFWPYLGASYILVAQKVVGAAITIRPRLAEKTLVPQKILVKPTSRVSQCNKI